MPAQKTCFVIAPIGEPDSEIRRRSDQIFKHVITPAAKECEYEPIRADQISEPGIITTQVIQHVVEDPLVVADLTDQNPNVFYELAIRHAIKRPLVQVIKEGEQIPFDVAGTRTVHVDHQNLDSVEEAKIDIVKQIRAVEKDASQIDTPISVALDLQILKQSDNPEQRSIADLMSAISGLRTSMAGIEKRLNDPESILPRQYIDHLLMRVTQRTPSPPIPLIYELREIAEQLSTIDVSVKNKKKIEKLSDQLIRLARYNLDRYAHAGLSQERMIKLSD